MSKAINELTFQEVPLDAKVAMGIGARLATNIKLQEHLYLEIKFDYDLGKHFNFNEAKMAIQGITGGLTYLF